MKKILLLGAAALLSASAAWAESRFFQAGDPITDISQLKNDDHDGLYFLQAYQNIRKHSGFYEAHGNRFRYEPNDVTTVSEIGETSEGMIFKISFAEDEPDAFIVQNYSTQQYLSTQGQNGVGKHNAVPTGNISASGHFTLVAIPEGSSIINQEDPLKDYRFVVESTNAYFDGKESNGRFHWFSNDLEEGGALTYHQNVMVDGNAQVAFIPAKKVDSHTATVTLPSLSGTGTMTQNVEIFDGYSVEPYIQMLIEELGGMTDIEITSAAADGSLIASPDNTTFTVKGNWIADFEAKQVYRICVAPTDNPSALRYMLSTGEIRTKVDGMETLSRLIPERLWFFEKAGDADDTYTMHNLYNRNMAVHFEGTANGATASYTDEAEPTVFQFIPTEKTSQFYLKIAGTENAYVSDNSGNGYFTINNIATPDSYCLLQFYPLENRDMEALNLPISTERTVDNIENAVVTYNAHNIAAAIRRIEYWGGEQLVGWQPGRFNNADGDFQDKLKRAKELQALGDEADADEVEAIIDAISFEQLTVFNKIKPGMFYRFKNKLSGKYISSLTDKRNNRTYMELVPEKQANRSNTVFYIDGPEDGPWTIVSFDTGLVLPTFNGSSNNWHPVVKSDNNSDVSNEYAIVHQHLGGCVIHASTISGSHRHIYGGEKANPSGVVLASNDVSDDGHQWYVELVESLPVPLYNNEDDLTAWASVYSPVPLQILDGEAIVNTGKFTGSAIWKNAYLAGDIVPANTSVLLDYKGGGENSDRREGMSYIYLKPLYGQEIPQDLLFDVAAETEETETPATEHKDLNGGIYAIGMDADTHYYTLHETTSNNFRKYEGTAHATGDSYIPGFKAHIAIPASDDNLESYAIVDDPTSSIEEISAGNGVKAVYDLQGRKLAAPAKGINIINGKKVLVK